MSIAAEDISAGGWARRSPVTAAGRTIGPVTASRQRRSLVIYGLLCVLGMAPVLTGMSPALQAAGLGLWFPGAGFIAAGGWALLGVPATLALFALALFAWFGAGMVIAPVIVWAAAAGLAALATGAGPIWNAAPFIVMGFVAAGAGYIGVKARAQRAKGLASRAARDAMIPKAVDRVLKTAAPRPATEDRELTAEDLSAVRYVLDRGLQPVGQFNGFDIIDQFQTSSLRYQIDHAGYCLAELQCNWTPNFHGYLSLAQRNLIEKYLEKKVWSYWRYETSWGHLNLVNHDPAAKDNIMLTGWLALHVGMYQLASGDRRYDAPGSLTFRDSPTKAYSHSLPSLVSSVRDNYAVAPFCLYPCEPNWVYPVCNHYGMTSLVVNDRLAGTTDSADLTDRWLTNLDAEFTDESGSIVGLRSSLTGLRFPFPGGEVGFAVMMNTFAPARAWRMWAVARTELDYITKKTPEGEDRLMLGGAGFDFGNYGRGHGGSYGAIMTVAQEFGDTGLAAAAQRALDADCGRTVDGGVLRYEKMSNLSNINAVIGRLRRRGDYESAVKHGPSAEAMRGPILDEASYPEVLVARAISNGEDLLLVLHPGAAPGIQTIGLSRLVPGRGYAVTGAQTGAVTADADGRARLDVMLDGRTPVQITPAG